MNTNLITRLLACASAFALLVGAVGCTTVNPRTKAMLEARAAQIAAEPQGDYFIGRRYFVMRTQFWGYLRRPGQPWDKAQLVIMQERIQRQPDHVDGASFGYDNNYEYKIWGRFSGEKIYDPNSNLFLPEFVLQRTQPTSANPGFLFDPEERRSVAMLPQIR